MVSSDSVIACVSRTAYWKGRRTWNGQQAPYALGLGIWYAAHGAAVTDSDLSAHLGPTCSFLSQ